MKYKVEEIGKRIRTQDNLTPHPIFFVGSWEWERKIWVPIQPFFTEAAAQAFCDANRHDYGTLLVYVASGYDNPEWRAVRNALMGVFDRTEELLDLVRKMREEILLLCRPGYTPGAATVDLLCKAERELER